MDPVESLEGRLRENPFAAIEADYYTDPENLVRHFSVNVLKLIPEFFVQPNVLMCGGQGTGKTMLFRYLDYATQKRTIKKSGLWYQKLLTS